MGEDKKSDGEARAHAKRAWISYFVSSVRSGRKHFRAQRYIYIYIFGRRDRTLPSARVRELVDGFDGEKRVNFATFLRVTRGLGRVI